MEISLDDGDDFLFSALVVPGSFAVECADDYGIQPTAVVANGCMAG